GCRRTRRRRLPRRCPKRSAVKTTRCTSRRCGARCRCSRPTASWPPTAPTPHGWCSPARWRKCERHRSTCRKPIRTSSCMAAKNLLLGGLAAVLVLYLLTIVRGGLERPTLLQTAIGFVTAFFDTLGIGSFATTTSVYKLRNLVPVKLIPGTLNVGHTLSTI